MAHHSSTPFGDSPPDALRELMEPRAAFGATGQFPQGKYNEQDEGEIQFGVAADKKAGKVIVNFGKPTAWVGMDREQAIAFADSLRQKADDLLDISK